MRAQCAANSTATTSCAAASCTASCSVTRCAGHKPAYFLPRGLLARAGLPSGIREGEVRVPVPTYPRPHDALRSLEQLRPRAWHARARPRGTARWRCPGPFCVVVVCDMFACDSDSMLRVPQVMRRRPMKTHEFGVHGFFMGWPFFTKRSRNRRETDRAEITYGSRKSHENMPQHASWMLICLHAHEINALGVMCVL